MFVRSRGPIRIEASERREDGGRQLVILVEAPGGLKDGSTGGFSSSFEVLGPGDLGLALPLARALIELHGGTLTAEAGQTVRLVATIPVRASPGSTGD